MINLNELESLQNSILQAFSPRQEYACITLVIPYTIDDLTYDNNYRNYLDEMCIQHPHVSKMLRTFDRQSNSLDLLPLVVPINNSERPMFEVVNLKQHGGTMTRSLRHLLEKHLRAVSVCDYSAEEKAVTIDLLEDAMMDGLMEQGPIVVSATKAQRLARNTLTMAYSALRFFANKKLERPEMYVGIKGDDFHFE